MKWTFGEGRPKPTPREEELEAELLKKQDALHEQHLAAGLAQWDRELREAELEERSTVDHLTGLSNRKVFEQDLNQILSRVHRAEEDTEGRQDRIDDAGLIYIDIDHFKQVNDTIGHAGGDAVLVAVADVLKHAVREGDTVARMGGEEMAIIMPGASAGAAATHAEDIRTKIEALTFDQYPDLKVTASFGVASAKDSSDATTLNKYADDALYRAKNTGRNQVIVHEAS